MLSIPIRVYFPGIDECGWGIAVMDRVKKEKLSFIDDIMIREDFEG